MPQHGPASVTDLPATQERYLQLCRDLIATRVDPRKRWDTFVELAYQRSRLRAQGLSASSYGLIGNADKEVTARARELLLGMIAHFDNERLYAAVAGVEADAGSQLFVDEVSKHLHSLSSWGESERMLEATGFASVQEDVLSQEFAAIATDHGFDGLLAVGRLVKFLRARANALASWSYVGGLLRANVNPGGTALSLGTGVAQFEEIVSRRLDLDIDAIDILKCPDWVDIYGRIRYLNADIQTRFHGWPEDSLDLIIMKDVLHEIPSPAAVLGAVRAKLKSGGILLIIEPHFREDERHTLEAMIELDSTPYPSSFMSAEGIAHTLDREGLYEISRLTVAPGMLDNNDSFARSVWVFNK